MKLLMLSTYPPDRCGVGDYTAGLCSVLSQRFSIDVITYSLPTKNRAIQEGRLRVHRVLPNRVGPADVQKFVKQVEPDVVHIQASTFMHDPRLYLLARQVRDRPLLATVHDTPRGTRQIPWKILSQNLYDHSVGLVVHSLRVREELQGSYGIPSEKIINLPHGVDTEFFSPKESQRGQTSEADDLVNFGFFGFLVRGKGIETLLKAFSLARPEMPQSHLTLIGGDGSSSRGALVPSIHRPYRETVVQIAKSLGISGDLTLTGFVEYSKLPQTLAAVDVFVLPYEGSPTASGVAPIVLSLGRPLICSRVAYFTELMGPDVACFVTPRNVEELAAAMIRLYSDGELRKKLGEAARTFALKRLAWQSLLDEIFRIYHDSDSKANNRKELST